MSLPAVEGFEFFETGGMGAYVNGEKVLLGTANFILRMGIRVAEGINLKNGVFVAINMRLQASFRLSMTRSPLSGVRLRIWSSIRLFRFWLFATLTLRPSL